MLSPSIPQRKTRSATLASLNQQKQEAASQSGTAMPLSPNPPMHLMAHQPPPRRVKRSRRMFLNPRRTGVTASSTHTPDDSTSGKIPSSSTSSSTATTSQQTQTILVLLGIMVFCVLLEVIVVDIMFLGPGGHITNIHLSTADIFVSDTGALIESLNLPADTKGKSSPKQLNGNATNEEENNNNQTISTAVTAPA